MTNDEYEREHHALRSTGALGFAPTAQLSTREYDVIVVALVTRLLCPRLPRLGERVLVRADLTSTRWTAAAVDLVGEVGGVQTEAVAAGERLVRGEYRHRWRYAPGSGPAEAPQ